MDKKFILNKKIDKLFIKHGYSIAWVDYTTAETLVIIISILRQYYSISIRVRTNNQYQLIIPPVTKHFCETYTQALTIAIDFAIEQTGE